MSEHKAEPLAISERSAQKTKMTLDKISIKIELANPLDTQQQTVSAEDESYSLIAQPKK